MRSLYPGKDKVGDLASAESDSSGKLDFHIVRLLKNGAKDQNEGKLLKQFNIISFEVNVL